MTTFHGKNANNEFAMKAIHNTKWWLILRQHNPFFLRKESRDNVVLILRQYMAIFDSKENLNEQSEKIELVKVAGHKKNLKIKNKNSQPKKLNQK